MQKAPLPFNRMETGLCFGPLLLSCYSQGNAKRKKGPDTSMGLRTVAGTQIAPEAQAGRDRPAQRRNMKHENRLTFRPATMDDAATVLALICRCESAEYGSPTPTSKTSPTTGSRLTSPHVPDWSLLPTAHSKGTPPFCRGRRPQPRILRRSRFGRNRSQCPDAGLLHRVDQLSSTSRQPLTPSSATSTNATPNSCATPICARLLYHQMAFVAKTPPTQPTWPVGVTVRTFQPGVTNAQSITSSKAFFARSAPPRRSLRGDHMLRADILNQTSGFAIADDEVIGASLAYNYETGGWCVIPGVLPQWQATALSRPAATHVRPILRARRQVGGAQRRFQTA